MKSFFLQENAPKSRLAEAQNARNNRAEILAAYSQGRVSRRDLIKMGLFSGAGVLLATNGLSPFVSSAYGKDATGTLVSPGLAGLAFTQPLLRFDVLERHTNVFTGAVDPAPLCEANQAPYVCPPELGGGFGPCEGRPPG